MGLTGPYGKAQEVFYPNNETPQGNFYYHLSESARAQRLLLEVREASLPFPPLCVVLRFSRLWRDSAAQLLVGAHNLQFL